LEEGLSDVSYGDASYTLIARDTFAWLMRKEYGIPELVTDLHTPAPYVNMEISF
jgi:hypothetical protein